MMMTTDIKTDPATSPAGRGPLRLPPSTLPLLTTRCLATALALQVLGLTVPALGTLLPLGLVLSAIGLGAYACVRSGRIENGWAILGLLPIVGLLLAYIVLRFRRVLPNAPVNALRGAVHTVLLSLMLFSAVAAMFALTQRGSEIHGEVPDYFPILAVVPDGTSFAAHIVPKRKFDTFAREHPDFSYLVPKHLEASLHENLHDGSGGTFGRGYFKVTEISADRQAFEVRYPIHEEAYSVGWYEATAQGIEPKRYLSFHDMMLGFFVIPALIIGGAIDSLFTWLLNRMLWPRFSMRDDEVVAAG